MATGIYADKRWPPLRARVLRRDDYLCQQCLRYGKHRAATTVHHCFPAGRYPSYAWAAWNLVSLCSRCHDAMHDRNSEQLTALGEQWRGDRAETKQPGARAGTLEADFLGCADFARKSETFLAKQRPEACPKWTQKERET